MPASAEPQILAGRYLLDAVVGEGGMAVVWRATDRKLNRTVAVKMLRGQYASDPAFLKRFESEARAAAALNDPGVVAVYDVGEDAGRHYLVLEMVPGEDLKSVIRREAPLAPERVVRYAAALARAVAAAHKIGLVHRDLKPQNVLITPDGRLKVADFGIARAIADAGVTAPGIVMGTAHYVAPEQAAGGTATPASDVYALGVVLYEMLTGRVPFDADTAMGVAMRIMNEDPPSVMDLNPQVPERLAAIVSRAMARKPEDRYADAGALAHVLEAYLKWTVQDTDVGLGRSAEGQTPAKPNRPPSGAEAVDALLSPKPSGPSATGEAGQPADAGASLPAGRGIAGPSAVETGTFPGPSPAEPGRGVAAGGRPSQRMHEPSGVISSPGAVSARPGTVQSRRGPTDDGPLFDWTGLVLALVAAAALAGLIPLWYQVYVRGGANGVLPAGDVSGTPSGQQNGQSGTPSGDAGSSQPFLGSTDGAGSGALVSVPTVTGKPEAEAVAALKALGLSSTTEPTDGTPPAGLESGEVAEQSPRAGETVPAGTVVRLVVVAKRLSMVEVPNVIGQSYDAASGTAQALGLVPEYRQVWSGRGSNAENSVVAVNPSPGSQAMAGDRIILSVNSGPYLSLGVTLGDGLFLAGASLDANRVSPGESFVVEPRWEAVQKVEGDYTAVAVLEDASGNEVARAVASPLTDSGPSSSLEAGAKAKGRILELVVPGGTAAGEYGLWLFVHRDGADSDVLPVKSGGYARVRGNRVQVMEVRVGQ